MSLINTEIKPFKANAFHNGKFVEITEATLKGKWSVIVFMPAAFTFNCPTEVEDAAENYAEFQKLGAEVYVVTTDTHFSHKVWHETSPAVGKAKFPLVGDPNYYAYVRIVLFLFLGACVSLGVGRMIRSFLTERSPEVRQQLVLLAVGSALAIGPALLLSLLPMLVLERPIVSMEVTSVTLGLLPLAFA